MKAKSNLIEQVAAPLRNLGVQLQTISVPNIKIDGVKPIITMTQPFSGQGKQLQQAAQDAKSASTSISKVSDSIAQDGEKLSDEILNTIDQSLKSLSLLQNQNLPKAINNLKTTSENLLSVKKANRYASRRHLIYTGLRISFGLLVRRQQLVLPFISIS